MPTKDPNQPPNAYQKFLDAADSILPSPETVIKLGLPALGVVFPPAAPFIAGFLATGAVLKAKALGVDVDGIAKQCIADFLTSPDAAALVKAGGAPLQQRLKEEGDKCLAKVHVATAALSTPAELPPGLHVFVNTSPYAAKMDGFVHFPWRSFDSGAKVVVDTKLYARMLKYWSHQGDTGGDWQFQWTSVPFADSSPDDLWAWVAGFVSNGDVGFYDRDASWALLHNGPALKAAVSADVKAANFGASTAELIVNAVKLAGKTDAKVIAEWQRMIRRAFGDPNWETWSPPPPPKATGLERVQGWFENPLVVVGAVALGVAVVGGLVVAVASSSKKAA